MVEKLIELLVQFWERITPVQILRVYEVGAVLRFGLFNRAVTPGLVWKWPLAEELFSYNGCVTTLRLPPQSLTSQDDKAVVISAIIKYQIVNVRPYIEEIWDQHDVLADVTMGAIRKAVIGMHWADLITESPEKRVLDLVRSEVNRYGFKVHAITFTDLGHVRSLRLIQQVAKDIDN